MRAWLKEVWQSQNTSGGIDTCRHLHTRKPKREEDVGLEFSFGCPQSHGGKYGPGGSCQKCFLVAAVAGGKETSVVERTE